jgi:ribosomal protein RSM22 (predicted rRNA methylase)
MTGLPPALAQGVARILEGVSRNEIAQRSARLSQHYRAGGTSKAVADDLDVAAYLLARLPATYAATAAVLAQVAARIPAFDPASVLDVGAGPGTASWAAVQAWPAIAGVRLVDNSPVFLDTAIRLAAQSAHPALSKAVTIRNDVAVRADLPKADMVIASYALAEIPGPRIAALAASLWDACGAVLVLIEPGTPAGFQRILTCRDALLAQGAAIAAPCPHRQACPVAAPDWCHFAQRLPRSRDHMLAKSAIVPFEDEKFSYLAVAREHVAIAPCRGRILAPPRRNKAALTMKVCEAGAVRTVAIASRDREAFARHRRLDWGDALEF